MARVAGTGKETTTQGRGVGAPTLEELQAGTAMLKPGHHGPAVLEVKKLFNQIGRDNPHYQPLTENDRYDPALLKKVARFQTNHPALYHKQSHGNVDAATLAALQALAAGEPAPQPTGTKADKALAAGGPGFYTTVQRGDSLDAIARRFKLGSYLDLLADDRNACFRDNPHALALGAQVFVPVSVPMAIDLGANDSFVRPPHDTRGLVIRPGETSPYVDAVRSTLRKLNYKGPLPASGSAYDHATEIGVRWYQANFESYRGRVDGVVGEAVWNGFKTELGVAAGKPPSALLAATLPTTPAKLPAPLQPGVRLRVPTPTSTGPRPAPPLHGAPQPAPALGPPAASATTVMDVPPLFRSISRGKVGFDVEAAERVLNRLGVTPPLAVDASAGAKLQTAVIWYQRTRALETVDGVIGTETWAKMIQEVGSTPLLRTDVRIEVDGAALQTAAQAGGFATLAVLAAEDPARARKLVGYAGGTAGKPLVIDLELVDKVASLGARLGMPFGDANEGSYEAARVRMELLGQVVSGTRIDTAKLDVATWDSRILAAAAKHHVDPALIKAVMKSESDMHQTRNGKTLASKAGALGLMQLMPATARGLGVDPHDAGQNILGGAKHLAWLVAKYNGDLQKVIAAYNAGDRAVDKYGGVPPYGETVNYLRRVRAAYEYYKASGQPKA
ncbi:MAG: peptidoglycan-binding protein [Deltaproteobacteria bacterium]|nr:peptidoglycan-binding protein [Deltaproteobacteria bacterium]